MEIKKIVVSNLEDLDSVVKLFQGYETINKPILNEVVIHIKNPDTDSK